VFLMEYDEQSISVDDNVLRHDAGAVIDLWLLL